MTPRLNARTERDIESGFDNNREAHRLLDLIDAEFRSDPMAVQCFDLRVVEEVKICVARRKELLRRLGPFAA